MHKTTGPKFDVVLMADDLARLGWFPVDLARRADVSHMTVSRFLHREVQTARTAKKLAEALGFSVSRYLIPSSRVSGSDAKSQNVSSRSRVA